MVSDCGSEIGLGKMSSGDCQGRAWWLSYLGDIRVWAYFKGGLGGKLKFHMEFQV